MTRFINDIKQETLVAYDNLMVGFYDKMVGKGFLNEKLGVWETKEVKALYIYIKNINDKFTETRRAAQDREIKLNNGNIEKHPETVLFKKAYDVYLKRQGAEFDDTDSKIKALQARIAELENVKAADAAEDKKREVRQKQQKAKEAAKTGVSQKADTVSKETKKK